MSSRKHTESISFMRWALPAMGYRSDAFKKPMRQVLRKIRHRMHSLEICTFPEYRDYLKLHPEEWVVLERLCDVTISRFFRNRPVWEMLRDRILPGLVRRRTPAPLRFWSVGSCNGEEPLSIAIILMELFARMRDQAGIEDPVWRPCPVTILATDRNQAVMKRARRGFFPAGSLRELTRQEIERYFRPAWFEEDEDYQIRGDLLQMVEFDERDISGRLPAGLFDMVFCRNLVFTYFSIERQEEFLERLIPRLAPGGYLVLGADELLPDDRRFRATSREHSIYQLLGADRE